LFNNQPYEADFTSGSMALEYALDGDEAQLVWQYTGDTMSITFGDVQRLGNNNTAVTFSNSGQIQEVDAETNAPVLTMAWAAAIGYATRRETLYSF
jgi:hypothetical protein